MAKDISFSEFLKEGAFQNDRSAGKEEPLAEKPIRIEPDAPANDKELKEYWKKVRHFFRTGERPKGANGNLIPALLAPYLKAGNYTNEYPIFISEDGSDCQSLSDLVRQAFDKLFAKGEAKIIRKNLPRILRNFKTVASKEKHQASFAVAWKEAENDLRKVDVRGDKKTKYLSNIDKLKEELPNEGYILRFTDEAPIVMINQQLKRLSNKRLALLSKVKVQIEALGEILATNEIRKPSKEKSSSRKGVEFAEDMISFDKVNELMPVEATEGLSEARKARLSSTIQSLVEGRKRFKILSGHFIVTDALFSSFEWQEILPEAHISKAAVNEGYKLTEDTFDESIAQFAKLVAAHRTAALELKDAYKEDIHDDFFRYFSWHRLTDEELLLFPPVLFVGETDGFLKNNLARFSALLSKNKPLRLLSLEKRLVNEPNPDVNWEDASHSYRQELSALAIAHRSTHTFQCAINHPIVAYEGIGKSLEVPAPSITHLLIPDSQEIKLTEILKLSAAVEGRFFPCISYDLHGTDKWGSRFDIRSNPQFEADWPEHEFTFVDTDGEEKTQPLRFTYADYKAITKEKSEELMIIPESYKVDDLIALVEYLESPVDQLTGKVPFIWLVNEDNCLKRAALPYMWVVSCQERLDNWNYVQELGGINSHHVSEALSREKQKWEKAKSIEIESLNALKDDQVLKAENDAADEAMERLTNVLLGLEDAPGRTKAPAKAKTKAEAKEAVIEKAEETKAEVEEKEEVTEAWISSFNCTTCNECTDNYPHLFAYNEDKQAYITDASKGKFSELVLAAEECPAKCIHPGAPLNKSEANVTEMIERAKPFN